MNKKYLRGVLALSSVVFVVATLVGCATGAADSATSEEGTTDAGTTDAGTDEGRIQPEASPLDPYLDILYGRDGGDEVTQRLVAQDEEIAECMSAAGFEYTPKPAAYFEAERAAYVTQPDSREWVAVNGYGLSTLGVTDYPDPNADYVASLSEAESQAYHLALWGTQNSVAGGTTGCSGSGDSASQPLSLSERYAPLVEALERLYGDTIPSTDDAVSAEADWSGCMAGAGYPGLATRSDAQALATEVEASSPSGPRAAGTAVDAAKLAHEVEVALADFDCRAETQYDKRLRAVTHAGELRFLEENEHQLNALLADAEQGE